MTSEELLRLIAEGEGQHLDFKRGVPSPKDLAVDVVCFANAEGGRILLGVDKKGQIRGIQQYDIPNLVSEIYRNTQPPITVYIEDVMTPQGIVLVVEVRAGAFVHSTTGGVYKRRLGKECLPMSPHEVITRQAERGLLDYSSNLTAACFSEDVDTIAVERVRQTLQRRSSPLAVQSDADLLRSLSLMKHQGEKKLTVAGLLTLGKRESLRRFLPQAEVVYLRQPHETEIHLQERLYAPLPMLLDRLEELIEAANEVRSFQYGLLRIEIPDFPKAVYREAILNAVVHRNYALEGNIVVRHFPDRLEVTSPGGFPTGVYPSNLLRQVVPRNRRLAEILQRIGYVEQAGIGVDMMFEEMLKRGKEPPEFDADIRRVRVILRNASLDERFVRFVEETVQAGKSLPLDYLLVLSYLKRHLEIDLPKVVTLLQRTERESSEVLSAMIREEILMRSGRREQAAYHLTPLVAKQLGLPRLGWMMEVTQDEQQLLLWMRVIQFVQEKGSIANAECREVCELSLTQASHLLSGMAQEGWLVAKGEKRWRRYILSEKTKRLLAESE